MKKRLLVVLFLSATFFAYAMEEGGGQAADSSSPSLEVSELKFLQSFDLLIKQGESLGIDCHFFRLIRNGGSMPVEQEDKNNAQLSSQDAYQKLSMAQAALTLRTIIAEKKKEKLKKKLPSLLRSKKD